MITFYLSTSVMPCNVGRDLHSAGNTYQAGFYSIPMVDHTSLFFHKAKMLPSFHPAADSWITLLTTAANLLLYSHSWKMVLGMATITFSSRERLNGQWFIDVTTFPPSKTLKLSLLMLLLSFHIHSQLQLLDNVSDL